MENNYKLTTTYRRPVSPYYR